MSGSTSAAYQRFMSSMMIGVEEWRDGIGYDLGALAEMTREEREQVEKMLIAKKSDDWRVVEALAALKTPRAKKALKKVMKDGNAEVQLAAATKLKEMGEISDRTATLIAALKAGETDSTVFSRAIDEIGWGKEMGTAPQLLKMALHSSGENACNCAAMLYYLYGVSEEAFDWAHRPFFLRFNTSNRGEREAAYRELCERIGVRVDAP